MRFLILIIGLVFAVSTHAAPWDVVVTAAAGLTFDGGDPVDTRELWRDCDDPAIATMVDADLQPPETYSGLITAPGVVEFCIRGRNAGGLGPFPDPAFFYPGVAVSRPGAMNGGTITITVTDGG